MHARWRAYRTAPKCGQGMPWYTRPSPLVGAAPFASAHRQFGGDLFDGVGGRGDDDIRLAPVQAERRGGAAEGALRDGGADHAALQPGGCDPRADLGGRLERLARALVLDELD